MTEVVFWIISGGEWTRHLMQVTLLVARALLLFYVVRQAR